MYAKKILSHNERYVDIFKFLYKILICNETQIQTIHMTKFSIQYLIKRCCGLKYSNPTR